MCRNQCGKFGLIDSKVSRPKDGKTIHAFSVQQPNEEIFRQFRSMGTMNYTKINYTLLELFHLVGRFELQNEIVYVELAGKDVVFPRNKINKAKINHHDLPSDTEIAIEINRARDDALQSISKFGIIWNASEIESCEYVRMKKNGTIESLADEIDTSDDETDHVQPENTEASSYIDITLENGVRKTIRKSTYIWSLTDSKKHLSDDRLKRVQESTITQKTDKPKQVKRQLVFKKEISKTECLPIATLSKNDELMIGDWCIFQVQKIPTELSSGRVFVLGNILSFKYIIENNAKKKQYSWDFAPVTPPKGAVKRGIEVLATWYEIGLNPKFLPMDELNSFYININEYVFTFNCPNIKIEQNFLSFTNDIKLLEQFHHHLVEKTQK